MTVIDTSALVAIILDEPMAEACMTAIERDPELAISSSLHDGVSARRWVNFSAIWCSKRFP